MAGKLSFSYSKMGMYKECPQKYKFRYVLKLPEKPKYYFAFGAALHKAREYLYSSLTPPFPPL
ncbi:MAG: PD-(D/E)XK nuclease family protein [Elusimicrobiaceae bacterium]|nr:PD-(D/E)XK nuclease family protein [Elusimicrobiaceae bacterium]